jgi:hypothetical protein
VDKRVGKVVFIDEATIKYNQNPFGKKVHIHPGEELEDKNFKPTSKTSQTNVGVFVAIVKGGRTELIFVRKRTPKEKTSERDKFCLYTASYANELHEPHLIPFIEGLEDPQSHIYLAADGAGYQWENK